MEDSVEKAKEFFVKLPEHYDDEILTFKDGKQPEAKFGDVFNFGDYRSIMAYIVGKNNVLIHNPDYSHAGYLTIPLEITQYLTDAVNKYSEIEVTDIDLRPDDALLKNWFGETPEIFKEFKFCWSNDIECLQITFPNRLSKEFYCPQVQYGYDQETHTLDDVMQYYEATKGPRCKVTLKYKIDVDNFERFAAKHSNKADVDKQLAELDDEIAKAMAETKPETVTDTSTTATPGTGGFASAPSAAPQPSLEPLPASKFTLPPSAFEASLGASPGSLANSVAFPTGTVAPAPTSQPAAAAGSFGSFGGVPPDPAAAAAATAAAGSFGSFGGVVPVPTGGSFSPLPFPPPKAVFPGYPIGGSGGFVGGGFVAGDPKVSALKMKRQNLARTVRFEEPQVISKFTCRDLGGMPFGFGVGPPTRIGTKFYEGPTGDVQELLDSLNAFYDTFEYSVEVVDM